MSLKNGLTIFFLLSSGLYSWKAESQKIERPPVQQVQSDLQPSPAALTEDESRMMVKEIPSVDIAATLARWKFPEGELAKLRDYSTRLMQDPGRTDFISQWRELISRAKARNPQLQSSDVGPLIQMLMLAAYEDTEKGLEASVEKVQFYKGMKERVEEYLNEARQMQGLLRSQRSDPLAGSLIRLPASQRVLRRCTVQPDATLRLDCTEVLISTTLELDAYLIESDSQAKQAEDQTKLATAALERIRESRQEKLTKLSGVAKTLYNAAVPIISRIGK